MAADQRRRRLNSSTIVGCSFREHREQYRAKKKKLGFPQDDTNGRSNISLEWDDKNKSVVAKREQIGILQRDLVPFIDAVPYSYSSLADILSVPREIFELENLVDVLSYEVWQTRISETERKVLTQFLPKGAEPEKTVQELLSGDNFHFGNPFLKWLKDRCSNWYIIFVYLVKDLKVTLLLSSDIPVVVPTVSVIVISYVSARSSFVV